MNNTYLSLALPCALTCAAISALYSHESVSQEKLEEIIITASRIEMPLRQVGASVSVIDQDEIEQRGYRSLTDLLRTQTGIAASNAGGAGKATGLRIRGEEQYRTLIMIDGVEVSDPTATQVGPQVHHLTVTDDIQRIEVLRGPQGFVYGADAGGVINIFTQTPKDGVKAQLSTEYGRYDSASLEGLVAGGNEQGDIFISAAHQKTNGFNSHVKDPSFDADGYENQTLHSKVGWNFKEHMRAQLVVRDVRAESEYDRCFTIDDCFNDFDQTTAKASVSYKTDKQGHDVGLSDTAIERQSYAAGVSSFHTSGDIDKLDYVGHVHFSEQYTLMFGGDFKKETVEVVDGENLARNQRAVFYEFQSNTNNRFFLTGGARFDNHDDFGKHTSVRFTSAYIQALDEDSIKYRASIGTGFRAPSLSEIAYNNGSFAFGAAADTQLQEENSQGYDLGLEYFHRSGATVELTYFKQTIENEIFFDLVSYSGYLQGSGNSTSKGFELAFDVPVSDFVSVYGNATYNDTTTLDDQPRIRRPEKLANLGVSLSLLGEKLKILTNLRVARDSENELFGLGRVPLDDYKALDVSGSYAVCDNLQLFARVENATDDIYQEITDYNASRAAAYVGAKLSL